MPDLALQNGPPSFDRLQLVAALIEYDNEDAPPEKRRDHRQSAVFTQFRPRPLDHLPHHGAPVRPPAHRSHTHQPSSYPAEYANDPDTRSRPASMAVASPPRVRDSVTMEILEGRKRFDPNARREVQGRDQEQDPNEEVDVSRWGLPDHLVAKEEPAQFTRPQSSMSTATRNRPLSSASRFVPEMRPISTMSMDHYLDKVQPASRPFPAARTTSVMTPTLGRARSVHLDVMGEEHLEDEFGAETALESAARIRRLVEGRETPPEGDRNRTRSGGSIGTRPDRGSRRVSFNELDVQDRPNSSMGLRTMSRSSGRTPPTSPPASRPRSAMRRQPSNPLMVPLPASPMHAPYATTSNYLPSIADDNHLQLDDEILPESEYSTPNPFAMPAPPAVIGSRFDPKQLEGQRVASRLSNHPRPETSISLQRSSLDMFADMARPASMYLPEQNHDGDQFIEEQDIGEMRVYEDIPTAEEYGKPLRPPKYTHARPQRLSRIDLLRPKTLLMPQSLVNQASPPSPPKKKWEIPPEGFSIGEKPLPTGARTSVLTINGVPRIPMSLSQRTFRSSLLVGGERGEAWVGGAEEDGEVGVTKKERDNMPAEVFERKAGKLYGKSLIDQLEARKAAMKGRQRYFTGDSRPAMMERSEFPSTGSDHVTSPTNTRAPLLQFDDNGDLHRSPTEPEMPYSSSNNRFSTMPTSTSLQLPPSRPIDRLTKSTSVFGVDQIWEREMAKLKTREAQEAEQAAITRQRQAEEERLKAETKSKKKKDKKGKGRESQPAPSDTGYQHQPEHRDLEADFSPVNRVPDLPPMLEFSPEKAPVQDLPSPQRDTRGSNDMSRRLSQSQSERTIHAVSDSDEEEDVPLSRVKQTSRSRPSSLYPRSLRAPTEEEESSDEGGDVPLARLRKPNPSTLIPSSSSKPTLSLATDFGPGLTLNQTPLSANGSLGLNVPVPQSASEMTQPTKEEVGEDDDVPLLLRQAHIKALAPPRNRDAEDEDDDVPLGVRQSMLLSTATGQSGFRPPNPSMYAQGHMYAGHPHPASMYGGYPPPSAGWGHQPHPQHQVPMHMAGWPQPHPQQPDQHPMSGYPNPNGYAFQPQPMGMNMGLGMGHMSFPDLTAMMQAQGQAFPGGSEHGRGGGVQGGNIDSWRKGVDPAVAPPPPSVGGGSRRS